MKHLLKRTLIASIILGLLAHPLQYTFAHAPATITAGTEAQPLPNDAQSPEAIAAAANAGGNAAEHNRFGALKKIYDYLFKKRKNPPTRKPPNKELWSSTDKMTSSQNALKHWKNHRSDFPGLKNSAEYVKAAKKFLQKPPPGTLTKVRPNGDILRYHPATNTFGVMTKNGIPRTMFKPNPSKHRFSSNLDYFNAQ